MAIHKAEPINTTHLNTLDVGWSHGLRGAEVIDICLAVFERAHQHLHTLAPDAHSRRLILYLPLGRSNDLTLWSDALWTNLGEDLEPPSLYVLNDAAAFDELAEEYRRPVPLPTSTSFPVQAIYRCFRSEEHSRREWEFSLGIYLL